MKITKLKIYLWEKILIYLLRNYIDSETTSMRVCKDLKVTYEGIVKNIKELVNLGFIYKRMKVGRDTPIRLTDKGKELAIHLNDSYNIFAEAYKQLENNKGK